jgi:hypothetical protein
MPYNLRVKHRGKWGRALEGFESKKKAREMAEWGYKHYQAYKIVPTGRHRKKPKRKKYKCGKCGRKFKTYKGYHTHVLHFCKKKRKRKKR